jgi:hypothetical protein
MQTIKDSSLVPSPRGSMISGLQDLTTAPFGTADSFDFNMILPG